MTTLTSFPSTLTLGLFPTMISPPSMDSTQDSTPSHSSPHSPHTTPDPMVPGKPEYSEHVECYNVDCTPTVTNSPHTTAPQLDSPNPSPLLRQVQLDFISLPTTRPSAPPQPTTTPMADRVKWETTALQPYATSPPTASASASFAKPHSPPSSNQTQLQNSHITTLVEAMPIDMKKEKYKLSPAAGGSTVLEDLRNPRKKKIFWVVNAIVLAIIFGVLGATIWKTDSNNKSPGGNSHRSLDTPITPSSTRGPTPNLAVLMPVVAPVPMPLTATTTAPPLPTATQEKFACMRVCGEESTKCRAPCENDPEYIKCNSACTEGFCRTVCREASSFTQIWETNVHACLRRCGNEDRGSRCKKQ